MKKLFWISLLCLANCPLPSYASQWCGFKGVYVGMKEDSVKKAGFSNCKKAQTSILDTVCAPDPSIVKFKTFGGEKVTLVDLGIHKGQVEMISITTDGKPGGGLEVDMVRKYGKPISKRGNWKNGSYTWKRSNEIITLMLENGQNEIIFNKDHSREDERKYLKKRTRDTRDF